MSNRSGLEAVTSSGRTVERYLLSLMARPFLTTLLIMLPALLLERLLRLFDLISSKGAPLVPVLRTLLDLVPHYLGLALPAALFIGVYFVMARLSRDNELDAMQSAGFSLARISRPFVLMGVVVALCGFGLYGYAQPLARYAYRADYQAATEGGWNATIPAGEVTHISPNLVVTADRYDQETGVLSNILMYRRRAGGTEDVTAARLGRVVLTSEGTQILLELEDGEQLEVLTDNRIQTLASGSTAMQRPFLLSATAFRPRGSDEREMTLNELWMARNTPPPTLSRRRLDGELHSRLVRSLSLALLPLLAVPVGLAAKRVRRHYGVVVGVVILVIYHHAIQLAQSMGASGLITPGPALWGAFALFAVFCVSLFRHAERHTSEGPFDRILDVLKQATGVFQRAWHGMSTERRA